MSPLLKRALAKGSLVEDSWLGFATKVIPKDATMGSNINLPHMT